MAPFPRGTSQLPGGRTIAPDYLHRWKRAYSQQNRHLLCTWIYHSCLQRLCQNHCWYLLLPHDFPAALLLTKGLILQIMRCDNRFICWRSCRSSTSLKFVMGEEDIVSKLSSGIPVCLCKFICSCSFEFVLDGSPSFSCIPVHLMSSSLSLLSLLHAHLFSPVASPDDFILKNRCRHSSLPETA